MRIKLQQNVKTCILLTACEQCGPKTVLRVQINTQKVNIQVQATGKLRLRKVKLNTKHIKKTIKIKQQITYEGALITIKPND